MSATVETSIFEAPRVSRAPTSFAQQRLWFLDQYEPNTALYNIAMAWRIIGDIDHAVLKKSINEIVRRHEVLRTNFALDGQAPVQIIAERREIHLAMLDLSAAPDAESRMLQHVEHEAEMPFDLGHGPLLRAGLVRLGTREHVLLLTLHHIVSDGWSNSILLRELSMLFEAFSANRCTPLIELPVQYADFAIWQREWLREEELQKQLNYWRNALAGAPPALDLPTDRPRPTAVTHSGANLSVDLPAKLCDGLRALCLRSGTTTFMGLAAAFNVLLWRLSGQDDLCIGVPVANRHHAEIEGLIGFFVNTLVLRTKLTPTQSFDSVLEQIRSSMLDADAHQDLPFEKLVEELRPGRNTGRTPIFQVALVFNHASGEHLQFPGLAVQPLEIDARVAKFELTLGVTERAGRLSATFCYNTDLFDRSTVMRMAGYFITLLDAALANPQTRIDSLPLLDAAERRQLLHAWNDTEQAFSDQLCIHQLFERNVRAAPNAPAVIFEDQQLNYAQLNRCANQLAHGLCAQGVKPGDLVAICVERSLQMAIGVMGILKSGGAYVPFDPAWPEERKERLLRALDATVVVTTQQHLQQMRAVVGKVESVQRLFCLDGSPEIMEVQAGMQGSSNVQPCPVHWPLIEVEHYNNPDIAVSATDPAYVIFTSGSTGEPKGVMMSHQPVVNLIEWVNRHHQVTQRDRLLFVTSLCFDLSVYDLFGILAAGAVVDIAPENVLQDPHEFSRYLSDRPVTFWDSAPASLRFLTQFFGDQADSVAARTLRLVFLSGVWIPLDMPAQIGRLFPQAQVIALGGATEAAIWSNFHPIDAVAPHWRSIPYGKPIQNTRYYILDRRLEPVPIGVAGDLYIGGVCLASGYFGDPVLTAQKFLPDVHDERPDCRMYRTGDNARFFADGNIEFLGRSDQQVKIRGYRIELGEIESTLERHSAVRAAVVTAHRNGSDDQRLVAYVVGAHATAPSASDLRAYLKLTLPDYFLPSAYVFLDALPLNSSGKVDRRKLPEPDTARADLGRVYVAPRTPIEALLADIWGEVLKLDRVSIHDNFFELGGYSMSIVQVAFLLRERHGSTLTVRDLFGARDLEELAQRIAQCGSGLTDVSMGRGAPRPTSAAMSVSRGPQSYLASHRVADEVLWCHKHSGLTRAWFQYQFTIHSHRDWRLEEIRAALRAVVDRHPVLTTRFSLEGEAVWMHEGGFDDLEFSAIGAGADSLDAAREYLLKAERTPFDRVRGPLTRFKWIPLRSGGSVLFAQIDHVLFDLQSQAILLSDFAAALRSNGRIEQGQHDAPAPLYSDYCRWHRSVLTDDRLAQLQGYWRKQFMAPMASPDALFGVPDSDSTLPKWQQNRRVFDSEQSAQINAVCSELGVTPLVFFMGVFRWWALHQRHVGVCDMETDVLGRLRYEVNRTIGFFSNNLLLRFVSHEGMTLREVIEDTSGVFADAMAHQELPFFVLKQIANPALDDRNYHWPIKFSQQTSLIDNSAQAAAVEEFRTVQLGIAGGGAHPLCIYLTGNPSGWIVDCAHDSTRVSRQTVAGLVQSWVEILSTFQS